LTGIEPGGAAPARPRRLARRLLLALTSCVVALLVAECALRFVLFSPRVRRTELARHLRDAQLYAPISSRVYRQLDVLFQSPGTQRGHACFDWRFGWTSTDFDSSLVHRDEARLGDRRPVLLFGDSFSDCLRANLVCWEDLFERSELADRFCLLNYGVGGYGVDQFYLLMNSVIPRFADRDPVVIVAILIEDDLDRSYLPLRRVPKPSLLLEDGELVLQPLLRATPCAYMRANPVEIPSYLWRYVLFGTHLFGKDTATALTSERHHVEEKEAINRALIREIQRQLVEAGLDGFFLLFNGPASLASRGPYGWEEPFLLTTFEELELPFVSSKPWLLEYMRRTGATIEDLYFQDPANEKHYTDATIEAVFPVFLEGMRAYVEGAGG